MSEEWGDMIWIGISMIIGAVLLSMLFFFNGIGHDLTSAVYQEEADARALQETRVTLPYDEAKNLSGAEVLSAMMDMADRGIFTLVEINGTGYACGPIGTTLKEARSMANLMKGVQISESIITEPSAFLAKVLDDNYLTPQTHDVAALFEKFDKVAGSDKTMAQLSFDSWLIYEGETSRVLGILFKQKT